MDVPDLKSKFLSQYHKNNKRKISDSLFASFESIAKYGRRFPNIANFMLQNYPAKQILEKGFGIVHSPKFSNSLLKQLEKRNAHFINIDELPKQSDTKSVILLQDTFNASYDAQVILACYDVLDALGYTVLIAPLLNNGKAHHVKGYRNSFKKIATKQITQLKKVGKYWTTAN